MQGVSQHIKAVDGPGEAVLKSLLACDCFKPGHRIAPAMVRKDFLHLEKHAVCAGMLVKYLRRFLQRIVRQPVVAVEHAYIVARGHGARDVAGLGLSAVLREVHDLKAGVFGRIGIKNLRGFIG